MATFCDMAYTWDANKNKTSESITGVMSGYGFTAAGTTYDNEDLCISSSLPPPASSLLIDIDANGTADVNFQYDALGRRVARSGTGGSVVFVQMDQQTIADYPVGGAATTPTFRYVYASYIDEPVVRKTAGTGGTLVYFHRNQQYSVTAVTTSTGSIAERYAYTAYGQPTILDASASVLSSSAINNRYTYTGREWDATLGLHHFRARWINPIAGRFLVRDPIGLWDYQNLYCYVRNSASSAEFVGSNRLR
jgi:RHS repeat-associated protein